VTDVLRKQNEDGIFLQEVACVFKRKTRKAFRFFFANLIPIGI
jgi:hypothetical protein